MSENVDSTDPIDDISWDDKLKDLVEGFLDDAPSDLISTEEPVAEESEKDTAILLAERTVDIQRLQAEYINYKRRVDRDRDQARQRGIEAVLRDLLPMLDGIEAARSHGELSEAETMLADEVAKVASKYGLVSFGEEGDPFDPRIHEALMEISRPGYPVTTVAEVFQRGYSIGDRNIRPARVGVAQPDESEPE